MINDSIEGLYYWFQDALEYSDEMKAASEGKELTVRRKFIKPFLKR